MHERFNLTLPRLLSFWCAGNKTDLSVMPPAMALDHVPFLIMGDSRRSAVAGNTQSCHVREPNRSILFSEAFAPVPAKLVKTIQALEFVDMADLLPDNIEMRRREEGSSLGEAVMAVDRRARQVAKLPTWVQCFTTYISIVAKRHPNRV